MAHVRALGAARAVTTCQPGAEGASQGGPLALGGLTSWSLAALRERKTNVYDDPPPGEATEPGPADAAAGGPGSEYGGSGVGGYGNGDVGQGQGGSG